MTYLKKPLFSYEDVRAPRGCVPLDPSSFRTDVVKNVTPVICPTVEKLPELPQDTIDVWAANHYR